MTTALEDLLLRHIEAGTVPGAVALLGSGEAEVVAPASRPSTWPIVEEFQALHQPSL